MDYATRTIQEEAAGLESEARSIELVLLEGPDIVDCHVLRSRPSEGPDEWVAYVVADGAFSPTRLRESLRGRLPDERLPAAFVQITRMPLTPAGTLDEAALRGLEVLDEALLLEWERALGAHPEVRQAVVVREPWRESPSPFHVFDLLPEKVARDRVMPDVRAKSGRDETASTSPAVGDVVSARGGGAAWGSGAARPAEWVTDSAQDTSATPVRPARASGGRLEVDEHTPRTASDLLVRAAREHPEKQLFFLSPERAPAVSYAELLERAQRFLGGLRARGLRPGDMPILFIRDPLDCLTALWACFLGGFAPAPLSPPPSFAQLNAGLTKFRSTWTLLDRPLVIGDPHVVKALASAERLLEVQGIEAVSTATLNAAAPDLRIHSSRPDDLALLFLTSGSTGVPKAVTQSHRALVHHCLCTTQGTGQNHDDVSLNCMPLDHVGAIMCLHLREVYLGCTQLHVPIETVLQDPLTWLELIETYRATIAWAPNFFFALVNDRVKKAEGRQWDLSSMRCIVNAGEMIVPRTTRTFLRQLQPFGLPGTAMIPTWGMSETCSGFIYNPDFTLEGTHDDDPFVDIGPPVPGMDVRVVDAAGAVVDEGVIGALEVKGAVVTGGYLKNPEANVAAFTDDGWFRVGDLGFIRDGRVTFTGRQKDDVNINGVNYYCHEIEASVEELDEVEVSGVAACAVRNPGLDTDQLAVFFSPVDPRVVESDTRLLDLINRIRSGLVARLGLSPTYLVPIAKSEIARTAIGKIQRNTLADALLEGRYDALLKRLDLLNQNSNTLPAWFFSPKWHLEKPRFRLPARPKTWLIFEGDHSSDNPLEGLAATIDGSAGAIDGSAGAIDGSAGAIDGSTDTAEGPGQTIKSLGAALDGLGHAVRVRAGVRFEQLDPTHFVVDPGDPSHYERLFETLRTSGTRVEAILHLWTYQPPGGTNTQQGRNERSTTRERDDENERCATNERSDVNEQSGIRGASAMNEPPATDDPGTSDSSTTMQSPVLETVQTRGLFSLLNIVQAWSRDGNEVPARRLLVVTNRARAVTEDDIPAFEKGTLPGFIRTISQELPDLRCTLVDLPGDDLELDGHCLREELLYRAIDDEVAFRDGQRWTCSLEPVDLPRRPLVVEPIKPGGFYVVAGGLGALGAQVARALLARYGVRLLLLGRTPLEELSEDLRARLQELETAGGEVLYVSADVSDASQVERAVRLGKERFRSSKLDGVFHAAGQLHECSLLEETAGHMARSLAPKVLGAVNLARCLEPEEGGLFVCFSSVNGHFGGPNVAAFSAADSFLFSFSEHLRRRNIRAWCFGWSLWENLGISRGYVRSTIASLANRGYRSISAGQGVLSLLAGLHRAPANLLIGLDPSRLPMLRQVDHPPRPTCRMRAYVAATNQDISGFAGQVLPDRYGTPSHCRLEVLDRLPVNEAGDVDREQLVRRAQGGATDSGLSDRPLTDTELTLKQIFGEVLNTHNVRIDDNFFELGGHSLSATQLISKVTGAFNVAISLEAFYNDPTIRALAKAVEAGQARDAGENSTVEGDKTTPDGATRLLRELALLIIVMLMALFIYEVVRP